MAETKSFAEREQERKAAWEAAVEELRQAREAYALEADRYETLLVQLRGDLYNRTDRYWDGPEDPRIEAELNQMSEAIAARERLAELWIRRNNAEAELMTQGKWFPVD